MFSSNTAGVSPAGQQAYTSPGSFSFTVPFSVTSIAVVCVGGGGGGALGFGADGGNLRYVNNISVTPGETLTVSVGAGGPGTSTGNAGGDSFLKRGGTTLALASGGYSITTNVGTGGNGGLGAAGLSVSGSYGSVQNGGGGGGAGGYGGNGGNGGAGVNVAPTAGSGGAGGGGGYSLSGANNNFSLAYSFGNAGTSGGGVGILGSGANGAAGTNGLSPTGGGGGSGGSAGSETGAGVYGGGGGGGYSATNPAYSRSGVDGRSGAVRIIWGLGRSFPSTNTADV